MRVLLIKMSSMGDLIHTLPALTDAQKNIANIKFDWLVEDSFQEISGWHPAVNKIIPVKFRKWRNKLIFNLQNGEIANFAALLRAEYYDLVIDAQGLCKSAILARFARAKITSGFSRLSARESVASLFYNKRIAADSDGHAIAKIRSLFAGALGYQMPTSEPDYGVDWNKFLPQSAENIVKSQAIGVTKYLLFLHGTTWSTKHWPDDYWQQLAIIAGESNFAVHMTWATAEQKARVQSLASAVPAVKMLPHLSLTEAVVELLGAKATVAVDTGFGHLAAAIGVPTVSIYGPTDPKKIGTIGLTQGQEQAALPCIPCASKVCLLPQSAKQKFPACMWAVEPRMIWEKLQALLKNL